MTQLERNALARDVLDKNKVQACYDSTAVTGWPMIKGLCESHERLRLEAEGAAAVIADLEKQLASSEREVALLREHYRQIEPDIERADRHERDLKEIGRMIGCDHLDEGYLRCVRQRIDEGDAKARADLEAKLAACHGMIEFVASAKAEYVDPFDARKLLVEQKAKGWGE